MYMILIKLVMLSITKYCLYYSFSELLWTVSVNRLKVLRTACAFLKTVCTPQHSKFE